MPSENGVWRHDRRALGEQPTTEAVSDGCETSPLMVAQPHPMTAQLCLEYPVLFAEELVDIALLLFQPAAQRPDHQVQWDHACSLRQATLP